MQLSKYGVESSILEDILAYNPKLKLKISQTVSQEKHINRIRAAAEKKNTHLSRVLLLSDYNIYKQINYTYKSATASHSTVPSATTRYSTVSSQFGNLNHPRKHRGDQASRSSKVKRAGYDGQHNNIQQHHSRILVPKKSSEDQYHILSSQGGGDQSGGNKMRRITSLFVKHPQLSEMMTIAGEVVNKKTQSQMETSPDHSDSSTKKTRNCRSDRMGKSRKLTDYPVLNRNEFIAHSTSDYNTHSAQKRYKMRRNNTTHKIKKTAVSPKAVRKRKSILKASSSSLHTNLEHDVNETIFPISDNSYSHSEFWNSQTPVCSNQHGNEPSCESPSHFAIQQDVDVELPANNIHEQKSVNTEKIITDARDGMSSNSLGDKSFSVSKRSNGDFKIIVHSTNLTPDNAALIVWFENQSEKNEDSKQNLPLINTENQKSNKFRSNFTDFDENQIELLYSVFS